MIRFKVSAISIAILLSISASGGFAQENSGGSDVCKARQIQLDQAQKEANDLDLKIPKLPSRAKIGQALVASIRAAPVDKLENTLKSLNDWLRAAAPSRSVARAGLIAFRDYIAGVEAWKAAGQTFEEPKPPPSLVVDVQAVMQRRADLERRITQLKSDIDKLGCGSGPAPGQSSASDDLAGANAYCTNTAPQGEKPDVVVKMHKVCVDAYLKALHGD